MVSTLPHTLTTVLPQGLDYLSSPHSLFGHVFPVLLRDIFRFLTCGASIVPFAPGDKLGHLWRPRCQCLKEGELAMMTISNCHTSLTARSGIGLAVDTMPKARQSMAIYVENCILAVVTYCEFKLFSLCVRFEVRVVDGGKDESQRLGLYNLSLG